MTTNNDPGTVTRRSAIAGLGAAGLGVAIVSSMRSTAAQSAVADYSNHPLTGMWLAMANPGLPESPQFPAPSYFGPDGTVVLAFPVADVGQQGLVFQSSPVGVWVPYDDQTGHFTAVQTLSAPDGAFVGSVTIDGHPLVSDDGMTFIDDGSLVTVTIRDATGAVVVVVPPGTPSPPVTATRMAVGAPGFPGTPADATPTP